MEESRHRADRKGLCQLVEPRSDLMVPASHEFPARRARVASVTARLLSIAFLVGVALLPARLLAQIEVEGLEDEEVYDDAVSFRVVAETGFEYSALLDGVPLETGVLHEVTFAGYHELLVRRSPQGGGAEEEELVQFIVRATERGNAEWGLPPWVPYAPVPSAQAEFAGATLRLIVPDRYPRGLPVPLVAWVRNAEGARVGVNGFVTAPQWGDVSVRILRGAGSSFLPPFGVAGLQTYSAELGPLAVAGAIDIEAVTSWQQVSGTLATATDWGVNARRHVTGDLIVPAGIVLTIGAGSVVRVAPSVDLYVDGEIRVEGSTTRPVVFTAESPDTPWGGVILRNASARATLRGAILTGSGANPDWFDDVSDAGSSHRDEQPLIYASDGATALLEDCALIDNHGQGGHGEDAFLTLRRTLVQRCITVGQYNSGTITVEDSALIEFPAWDAPFEDEDNDGLYLTGGAHVLRDSLLGWALDDGIDAGSGSAGSVEVEGCWFESCYHEAMAWSEDRVATVRDTVSMNSGQGLECGFGSPEVDVQRLLSTANLTGARFGDNYDWDYDGFLTVADSLLLYNLRDTWGRAWDNWDVHTDQMDVAGNRLTVNDPDLPGNTLWSPGDDAALLAPYLPSAATAVGVGFATREDIVAIDDLLFGVPVRLSTFTTVPVEIGFVAEANGAVVAEARLLFAPGESVKTLSPAAIGLDARAAVSLRLVTPVNAEITAFASITVIRNEALIAKGSEWRYEDSGTDLGTAWRAPAYDDSEWEAGFAELGYGDDDERTTIEGGPSNDRYPTVYFRRRFTVDDPGAYEELRLGVKRDDGAVIYLNGAEVFRTNIEDGPVTYATYAGSSDTSEDAYFPAVVDPARLRAGENVIAVEVHQANATSSDVSFDLELLAVPVVSGSGRFVRGDVYADRSLDVGDAVRSLFILYEGLEGDCADAVDANDDGILDLADTLAIVNLLFLDGPSLAAPFPAAGLDPTDDPLGCDR